MRVEQLINHLEQLNSNDTAEVAKAALDLLTEDQAIEVVTDWAVDEILREELIANLED